jgi:hypothetical protein
MKDVLDEAGIEVTPENKKEVDGVIHRLVEVEYKNCSPAWKSADFIDRLRREWDKKH